MNMRDLLLLQSIFFLENTPDIVKIVELQGNPTIFYKSFLELDRRNMLSLLAFDSNSIKILLAGCNQKYFKEEFPIFYRSKSENLVRSDGRLYKKVLIANAIDSAMEHNQLRALSIMIDHIV